MIWSTLAANIDIEAHFKDAEGRGKPSGRGYHWVESGSVGWGIDSWRLS
jgi:hypothetical protein